MKGNGLCEGEFRSFRLKEITCTYTANGRKVGQPRYMRRYFEALVGEKLFQRR